MKITWLKLDAYGSFLGPVQHIHFACPDSALVISAASIPPGRWTHVAGVFDSADPLLIGTTPHSEALAITGSIIL